MKNKIIKSFEEIKKGYLIITGLTNKEIEIGDKNSDIKADMHINNTKVFDLISSKGDIGFGEAYIKGFFSTNNLLNLLSFILKNEKELKSLFNSNIFYLIFFKIKNLFRINDISGSKKNIKYHYDLGNDFYSLWLDKSMSYSSAIFYKDETLLKAQDNKYEKILGQINTSGANILEIGCGWGGFINNACNKGYEVSGLTISQKQKQYTDKLIEKNKLNAKVHLRDYRNEKNKFDNIVSIEMFEAVGKQYWNEYFIKLKNNLNNGGRAVIQTITIADNIYKKYLKKSDYIREYIFPGGLLPSPAIFRTLANKNGLEIVNEFNFGDSYAKTLSKWLKRFNKAEDDIIALGYNKEFIRLWRFYLVYCIVGFMYKRIDVGQYSMIHTQ